MHERRFNPEHMAKLDSPERKVALPPEPLLEKLALNENATILDLGAGTGYFTIPAAGRTYATVYALDVEPRMLEVVRSKAEQQQLKNVRLIEGHLEQIPLEAESVVRVIPSLVLHEAEPLHQALNEISQSSSPRRAMSMPGVGEEGDRTRAAAASSNRFRRVRRIV
ncbi:class I SAM-dependent methyltransferase [Cohnella massiliensis]|uniref:class I SAM-dependent methyltransferase n=1 Tax=Cohnella massiliensis TaxID=1816691 RepID=UPI001FEC5DC6|nr:class I SAM-dependent methyltransferase [Cohnella massiliensis]